MKFYKLAKVEIEPDNPAVVFLQEDGFRLPNNFGLDLVVYRADNKTWYVVELVSGSAVGSGNTRTKAVQDFADNIARLGVEGIRKATNKNIELYGKSPTYKAMEVL